MPAVSTCCPSGQNFLQASLDSDLPEAVVVPAGQSLQVSVGEGPSTSWYLPIGQSLQTPEESSLPFAHKAETQNVMVY